MGRRTVFGKDIQEPQDDGWITVSGNVRKSNNGPDSSSGRRNPGYNTRDYSGESVAPGRSGQSNNWRSEQFNPKSNMPQNFDYGSSRQSIGSKSSAHGIYEQSNEQSYRRPKPTSFVMPQNFKRDSSGPQSGGFSNSDYYMKYLKYKAKCDNKVSSSSGQY